jgi:hypothetical protein
VCVCVLLTSAGMKQRRGVRDRPPKKKPQKAPKTTAPTVTVPKSKPKRVSRKRKAEDDAQVPPPDDEHSPPPPSPVEEPVRELIDDPVDEPAVRKRGISIIYVSLTRDPAPLLQVRTRRIAKSVTTRKWKVLSPESRAQAIDILRDIQRYRSPSKSC